MMDEIKNCPFCGNKPKIYRSVFSEYYRIRCENGCGAETAPFFIKDEAIKAWNARISKKSRKNTKKEERCSVKKKGSFCEDFWWLPIVISIIALIRSLFF